MVGFTIFLKIEYEFPNAVPGSCRLQFLRYRAQIFFGSELVILGKLFQSWAVLEQKRRRNSKSKTEFLRGSPKWPKRRFGARFNRFGGVLAYF